VENATNAFLALSEDQAAQAQQLAEAITEVQHAALTLSAAVAQLKT
jgi:hypothetical protein